jgi:DNA-binding MarR family transcriptional regulator
LGAQLFSGEVALCNGTAPNYFMSMANPVQPTGGPDEQSIALNDALGELACTHTALRRAARRLGHLYDEAVSPTGLKATQVGLLSQIDAHGGAEGPTLQALAERLAIGISSLTYALRPLVRDGLIDLRQDPQDKRAKHASLTELGRKRLAEGLELWAVANRRTDVVLGHGSASTLRALADEVSSKEFLQAYKAAGSSARPGGPRAD